MHVSDGTYHGVFDHSVDDMPMHRAMFSEEKNTEGLVTILTNRFGIEHLRGGRSVGRSQSSRTVVTVPLTGTWFRSTPQSSPLFEWTRSVLFGILVTIRSPPRRIFVRR